MRPLARLLRFHPLLTLHSQDTFMLLLKGTIYLETPKHDAVVKVQNKLGTA